jgi:hypothetical protein
MHAKLRGAAAIEDALGLEDGDPKYERAHAIEDALRPKTVTPKYVGADAIEDALGEQPRRERHAV